MELNLYLKIFRAHWLGITLLTVLGVAVAYGWTILQPRVYTADSTAVIQAKQAEGSDNLNSASLENVVALGRVSTYVEVGTSRNVAQRAIDDLGLDETSESLVRSIRVSNPVDTTTLRVSANASSPEAARDLAEAWIRGMAVEVNVLESGDADTQGAVFLTPMDSARLPTAPSSPNVRLALALGGLVGLALGIGYAVVRHTLDRRVRSVDGVEEATGIAVVGTVPDEKTFRTEQRLIPFDGGNSATSRNAHLSGVAEAMRELRTNIQFMDVDHPPKVIVVTSPLPGDGKSTTASNLAITLAANGQRTILIDGDLRRPMISSIFGLVEGAGLTDVLAGRAEVPDVAQTVGKNRDLVIIGAGKIPPNPSEVLGSQRMRELLKTLSEHATVIIDAPPLIPVTDAAVVAHSADGAIVVAGVGKTTYDVLAKALGSLERAGSRALGIVLNRVPRKGAGAAYYGYQYHGDYYRSEAVDDDAADDVALVGASVHSEATRAQLRRSSRK